MYYLAQKGKHIMRKLNFIQLLFVKHYLRTRKKLIDRALSNNHYVVTELYSQKYKFAIVIEEVDEWIAELEHIGYKVALVNNIIFIW
jgi:hypothetical protein